MGQRLEELLRLILAVNIERTCAVGKIRVIRAHDTTFTAVDNPDEHTRLTVIGLRFATLPGPPVISK